MSFDPFEYQSYGIKAELANAIAGGVWSNQMIQYPRIKMIEVIDHHLFISNWCQHKNKIIFQYTKFSNCRWKVRLDRVNTEMAPNRISLKELKYLEGKGISFDKENDGYVKLKLGYIQELGT